MHDDGLDGARGCVMALGIMAVVWLVVWVIALLWPSPAHAQTAQLTVRDPLAGTHVVTTTFAQVQYTDALHWHVVPVSGKPYSGALHSLTYQRGTGGEFVARIDYTPVVPGRIFASGFQP